MVASQSRLTGRLGESCRALQTGVLLMSEVSWKLDVFLGSLTVMALGSFDSYAAG